MNMLMRPLRLTAEEFERMSDTDGLELIDGFPREKKVGLESSYVNNEFGAVLRNFVRPSRLGWVFDSESGYQCFPRRPRLVRKPDVSFVRRGRFPDDAIPRGHSTIAPDLAVEVVSYHDEWYEVEEKVDDYLSASVALIWVVNPVARTAFVFRPDGSVTRVKENDELTGEGVLPGFRVVLGELLPEPLRAAADNAPVTDA